MHAPNDATSHTIIAVRASLTAYSAPVNMFAWLQVCIPIKLPVIANVLVV
jgi:hypothetical protein